MSIFLITETHSTPCTFDVKGSSGIISSSDISGTDSPYCSWVITAPRGHNIRLKFTTFQLAALPSLQLQNWIRVFDGKSFNDMLLGSFSGTRKPFQVQSSGPYMLVMLERQKYVPSLCNFKGIFTSNITKGELIHIHFEKRTLCKQINSMSLISIHNFSLFRYVSPFYLGRTEEH